MNKASPEILSLFDNVIGMQLEEAEDALYQGMKVIKIRDSAFVPSVTKLIIPAAVSGLVGDATAAESQAPSLRE
jgi:circadian clock protein KaiC